MFTVEVSFEKESLRDVWFPATVLNNSGNLTFLEGDVCFVGLDREVLYIGEMDVGSDVVTDSELFSRKDGGAGKYRRNPIFFLF
ncbi:hypothetical protein Hanom_Chr07g00610761 [Helianthus anomalus]